MSTDASTREFIRQLQMLGCWDTAHAVIEDAARREAEDTTTTDGKE